MKGFNAFLDMKTCKDGVQKVGSWKYLTNLTPVPPVFLEHQVPHSCYPPWTLFRMCQRSTAAAAQDSVTKETNGKCPGQAPICSWQDSGEKNRGRKEGGVGEDLTHPSSQVSPWDVYQVCILGFAQERIQELALIKWKVYSGRYALHRQSVRHLRRRETPG